MTDSVDFDDIQALARFAHGHLKESAFLVLRIQNPDRARQWLQQAPVSRAIATKPLPETALQVAFSADGLRALGVNDALLGEFSSEFLQGMASNRNRSRRLGDIGTNSPAHWDWGGTESPSPHLLLMLYTAEGQLENQLDHLREDGFTDAFDTLAVLRSTTSSSVEPFGFTDGLSQPDIQWETPFELKPKTQDHYSNATSLGELLLGYPNEYGLYTSRPLLDPNASTAASNLPGASDTPRLKDLGRNGSYLVIRQLSQDVPTFWQFMAEQSGGDTDKRDNLAAAMVGRNRDGKPLAGDGSLNDFNFNDDPLGRRCPVGAHTRRANPRTGDFPPDVTGPVTRLLRTLGFCRRHPTDDLVASSRFHRLLRRGRVYGPPLTIDEALQSPPPPKAAEDRGLFFICLAANISRQFEFVQNAWMASAKFAGLPTESDPLLGQREPLLDGSTTDTFSRPRENAPADRVEGLPQFVTVRGGGYYFMPGLRALAFILQSSNNQGGN